LAPLAAQDLFVKEWEKSYSTKELTKAIRCLDIGDLDGDGSLEIVIGVSVRPQAGIQKYALHVLTSQGDIRYTWDSNYPITDVSIGDIDNSGPKEILVSGADLYVLSHKALNLNYPPIGTVVFSAVTYDLDADGKNEILAGTREVICRSETIPWTFSIGSQVKKIMVTDLSWDGIPEIVVLTDQNIHVLKTDGTRLWISPGTQNLRDVAVADIDGDRHAEILVSTDDRLILVWDTKDNELEKTLDLEFHLADFIAVEDINNDGNFEIVVASSKLQLEVLDLEGEIIWFYKFTARDVRDAFSDMVLVDINGDQQKDVVLAHSVLSLTTEQDSLLYFMQNQYQIVEEPDRGRELYDDALEKFNEGNCTDALPLFSQAQNEFLQEENQKMADACQEYMDQCEDMLALQEADSLFSQAESKFDQENYKDALELYKQARTTYEELEESEKAALCSQRITQIQDLLAPPQETVEPEPEPSGRRSLLFLVLLLVVAGGGVYYWMKMRKPLTAVVEYEEKEKEAVEVEEKVKDTKKVHIIPTEEIKKGERKLKAKFVYGEINRDQYREALRKLYESGVESEPESELESEPESELESEPESEN
jgi:tetratricopeptide (TPR) repeat protein